MGLLSSKVPPASLLQPLPSDQFIALAVLLASCLRRTGHYRGAERAYRQESPRMVWRVHIDRGCVDSVTSLPRDSWPIAEMSQIDASPQHGGGCRPESIGSVG